MTRRSARDTAFRLLYEYSINGEFNPATADVMRDCFDKGMNENAWNYVNEVINLYRANSNAIDELIKQNSKGWSITHMSKVDLAILRLGICEIKYIEDIHSNITINECVELAKKYSTEKSSKFINGVLAGVLNTEAPKSESTAVDNSGEGSPDER